MALRRAAVGTATAGLVTALTALVLSTLPALAHEGEEEGEGKDAIGEVDPDYPTKAILGDASGPGASCVDGQAGYFPCRNVNLASYLPMSDIGGGRGSRRPSVATPSPAATRHRLRRRHQRAPARLPGEPADVGHQQRHLARHQGLRRPRVHRRRGP